MTKLSDNNLIQSEMKIIFKKKLWFTAITTLCLSMFFAVSCEKNVEEPQVSNVSFTPCQQDILRSDNFSNKVDVEFTNKGVQIVYYDFEVTCDFTTVNVTYTLVNGVMRITQQGSPNQANCTCYTDVLYTIDGISQNEVNVIFINDIQVYCYNENGMDFSNIEDLYAQPLSIIQECVRGRWKVLEVSRWGYFGLLHPTNTIVDINNNVVITENEDEHYMIMNGLLNTSFSYSWKEKEVYQYGIGIRPPCYTTYVMQNNDQEIEGWYFDKIRNDTLHVVVDYQPDKSDCEAYLFLRIKN